MLLAAAYSLRSDFRLGVGQLGDAPYLSGFNSDEAGTPRYRWTGSPKLRSDEPAIGLITLPWGILPGAMNSVRITLRAGPDHNPPTVQVMVNGSPVGETRPDPGAYKTVEFSIPNAATGGDTTRIEISSGTFKPPNDGRYLGIEVSEVKLLSAPGWRKPTLDGWLWAWLYSLSVGLILLRLAGPEKLIWSGGAGVALVIPWLCLPLLVPDSLNLWYTPWLLPLLALSALTVAGLIWRQILAESLAGLLVRLESSPRLARYILLITLLLYSLYALSIIARMDYIGHADYADNAVAARNIVQGRGYSLDYAAQFYQLYSLPRPADTWPPLQPFMIAPFFAVFGPTVWAAKLPNLLLVPLLAWLIFVYGCRFFNRRTGLGAALLSLVAVIPAFSTAPALFETIAYPINDLVFSLLMLVVLMEFGGLPHRLNQVRRLLTSRLSGSIMPSEADRPVESLAVPLNNPFQSAAPAVPGQTATLEAAPVGARPGWPSRLKFLTHQPALSLVVLGLCSGLLFLSKPSGAILLVVAGLWALWQKYFARPRLAISWPMLFGLAGLALLVVTPYLVRNVLQFGTLYRSTEQYDTWVTKWNPPDDHIYDLFTLKGLPNPRQLLDYGWDNNLNAIINQFRRFFNHLWEGQLFAPLLLGLAGLGLAVIPHRHRGLAWLLAISLVVYVVFFNVGWHYEARYFLAWLPPLYLLGVYGLSWLYDKIKGGAGVWLVTLVLMLLAVPGLLALISEGKGYTSPTGIVITADWLKQNTPPGAVVMSRNVWELSFHSQRQSVMIPNAASLAEIKQVMGQYKANYLELDHLGSRSVNEQWGLRSAVWPLLDKTPQFQGFELLYDANGFVVYKWNGK